MTLSNLAFWKKSERKAKVNGGGGAKQFLSKISGAFMLPISVMAVAGLFLGLGAMMESQGTKHAIEGLMKFGSFVKNMGDPVFGAMPILFAAAIVVAFTDEAGVGVFAAIIGMLIFSALQSPFITDVKGLVAYKKFNLDTQTTEDVLGKDILYHISNKFSVDMAPMVGSTLGLKALNTSVFGGIMVGAVVAFLYNRFHTIALPQIISFFGGKRFVSLATIIAMVPLAVIILLLWPFVGWALAKFGNALGKVPYGFESLIFGVIERSLIPFGLHHVFYAPLWWTTAGASINSDDLATVGQHIDAVQFGQMSAKLSGLGGDQALWAASAALPFDEVKVTTAFTLHGNNFEANHSYALFPFIQDAFQVKLGKFMAGKYSFMMFGLPAAGAAMVMAAPKENRKMALGTVFPAALTSLVTGVTEPIEFTFLFLAPALFWGVHAVLAGISFMAANLLSVHTGMTFSGGILDMIIYGAIPVMKGTNFYWSLVIGAAYVPIYFFVFLWWIKKFNLDTPGRGGNTKLFSKKDFQASKSGSDKGGLKPQSSAIISAVGGWDNVTKYANCATRLRYDVKDASLVDDAALKAAGAAGVARVGSNHVQIIMGPVAEQINTNIKNNIGAKLDDAAAAPKAEVAKPAKAAVAAKPVAVKSVAAGTVRTLASLKDGVFSEKMMGDGIVVCAPKTAKSADFFAPVSGELVTVFPTGHAYGIRTEEGLEVLVHIGVDTVNLNGKGFTPAVKQGEMVKAGEKLATVDLDFVRKNAPTADAIVIVTSGQTLAKKATGKVTKTTTLFEVK